jgi:hypothetical protein
MVNAKEYARLRRQLEGEHDAIERAAVLWANDVPLLVTPRDCDPYNPKVILRFLGSSHEVDLRYGRQLQETSGSWGVSTRDTQACRQHVCRGIIRLAFLHHPRRCGSL